MSTKRSSIFRWPSSSNVSVLASVAVLRILPLPKANGSGLPNGGGLPIDRNYQPVGASGPSLKGLSELAAQVCMLTHRPFELYSAFYYAGEERIRGRSEPEHNSKLI